MKTLPREPLNEPLREVWIVGSPTGPDHVALTEKCALEHASILAAEHQDLGPFNVCKYVAYPFAAEPTAFAIVNDQGYYVGIWNDKATADLVLAKGNPANKERIVPMYDTAPAAPDKVAELEALVKDFSQIAGNLQKELSRLRPVVEAARDWKQARDDYYETWFFRDVMDSAAARKDMEDAEKNLIKELRKADRGE